MVLIGSSVVLALMGVVAGTGFIVPTGLANGAYILTEDSVTPAHFATEIAARDASDHPHSPNGLFKRLDNPVTSCDGYTYNSGDYQASYRNANAWCNDPNSFVEGNQAVVFVTNSVVAYVCNYTPSRNTCVHEFETADGLINVNCGLGRAGSVHVERYKKTFGRANEGVRICF